MTKFDPEAKPIEILVWMDDDGWWYWQENEAEPRYKGNKGFIGPGPAKTSARAWAKRNLVQIKRMVEPHDI